MNRLIVPEVELRLEVPDPLDVGDTLEVVQADGVAGITSPLGEATVVAFDRAGFPEFDVRLEVVMSGPGTAGYVLAQRQSAARRRWLHLFRRAA